MTGRIANQLATFAAFSVVLAFSTLARADFSIVAEDSAFRANEKLALTRTDFVTRKELNLESIQATSNGSLNVAIEHPPGTYALLRENGAKIDFAVNRGETLNLIEAKDSEAKLTWGNSPDSELLSKYESLRLESLERLVYPTRTDIKTAKLRFAGEEEIARLTQKEVDAYQAHLRELNDFAIDEIGDSPALYATSLRWNADYRFEDLQAIVESYLQRHGSVTDGNEMKERLSRFAKVALGAEAPNLRGTDLSGTTQDLSSLRGKYVLVDFWASWCAPCRLENKSYHELLSAFEEKEFEIFAVNVDQGKSPWARASKQDKIDWIQISDSQGWSSEYAAAYNVSALPASFLLDPEGHILAKNLRGPALQAKLSELVQ